MLIYCWVTIAARKSCWVTFIDKAGLCVIQLYCLFLIDQTWWSKFQVLSAHFGNVYLTSNLGYACVMEWNKVGGLHVM